MSVVLYITKGQWGLPLRAPELSLNRAAGRRRKWTVSTGVYPRLVALSLIEAHVRLGPVYDQEPTLAPGGADELR